MHPVISDALRNAHATYHEGLDRYYALTTKQRIAVWLGLGFAGFMGLGFLIWHQTLIAWLVGFAERVHDTPFAWVGLFLAICIISFPPLIGYSMISTFCGMAYGFPNGWPLLAAATIVGSTASFLIVSRRFANYARHLAQTNTKFAALTQTMEKDSFALLWMIRLCPLPYSLSNGALASIPSITPQAFALATAITSPKLLIHVFVGDRLARLGQGEKDWTSTLVDFLSIGIAVSAGAVTAYIVYTRTLQRAAEIEAEQHPNLDELDVLDDDEFIVNDV
ncbi:Golgi apparatus membrane protein [Yarrowia sp. C11]|nr:Golgi apparatus membrane protein [Yarrowia sp. E02]KAG5367619.1 Golgi apparatus membrane protein [Yarrowia sp. C11]